MKSQNPFFLLRALCVSSVASVLKRTFATLDGIPIRLPPGRSYWPKRWRYSMDSMKALTISACTKLPLNWLSFVSQKS